ncbi:AAA family ATPase, partial [Patescibacteria group bacterium]|nr:AAA family ATPase [Patescibacteria group bacterium]
MGVILGLTGEKLSGKGTVSDYLVENKNFKHYRFSKILDDIAERLYLPKTRQNLIDVALALREKFGPEILGHVLKKDIETEKVERAVVDGIRYWEEYNILKSLPGFHLVYVTATLENRFNRTRTRGEKEGEEETTFEEFKKMEEGPTEILIKEIGEKAEFKIENDGSYEELYNK